MCGVATAAVSFLLQSTVLTTRNVLNKFSQLPAMQDLAFSVAVADVGWAD